MRYMTMVTASEHYGPPPDALLEAMGNLIQEAAAAGVFVDGAGLTPSTMAARVRLEGGRVIVTDGPYSEAKEVVGGYSIFELPSKEAALAWTTRMIELHQRHWPEWEGECEVRPIYGRDDTEQMLRDRAVTAGR
jgi:hypothetical protein